MAVRTGKYSRWTTLRHPPNAARGIAQREFARCQRTICLPLTTMRFAPSTGNFAAVLFSVKRANSAAVYQEEYTTPAIAANYALAKTTRQKRNYNGIKTSIKRPLKSG